MLVALDANGDRIYASAEIDYKECYCNACGERVKHKNKGKIVRPYFSHLQNTCPYGDNKEYNHEWHIRMEELFPKEAREVRFVDDQTKEVHIADVYDKETNTVIEFQHSRIDEAEFIKRTNFHLENGRRIVWIFDERTQSNNNYERLTKRYRKLPNTLEAIKNGPYLERSFIWKRNPRRMLEQSNTGLYTKTYSVCVVTDDEGVIAHRIVKQEDGFHIVYFSLHEIQMRKGLDIEEFFQFESYWKSQEPWKSEFEQRNIEYERKKKEIDRLEKERKEYQADIDRKVDELKKMLAKRNIKPWF